MANLDHIEQLEPNAFQQKIQNDVSAYFGQLYKQMREVEREVIKQIRESTNLEQLRQALEALHQKLNHKEMDKLQEEK